MQEKKRKLSELLSITIEEVEPFSLEAVDAKYTDEVLHKQVNDKRVLNENAVARYFVEKNQLIFFHGKFYGVNGVVSDEQLKPDLQKSLEAIGVYKGVAAKVNSILEVCKMEATVKSFEVKENFIPFANGNLYLDKNVFRKNEITIEPYRFLVDFIDEEIDTPHFDKWCSDLLESDDYLSLLEFLGYLFVFTTKAQRALFLVGDGGVGKSCLGVIINSILGNAVINIKNLQEFNSGHFSDSCLENKPCLYVDDLDYAYMERTGDFKTMVTNENPITVDVKYMPHTTFTPKVRYVSCTNKMIVSKDDKSDGFHRRLYPLCTKPMSKDFEPDLNFKDRLRKEAVGIAQKALVALHRLIKDDWKLHESEKTREFLAELRSEDNPFPRFFDLHYILDPTAPGYPSKDITEKFKNWRSKNGLPHGRDRDIQNQLGELARKLGLKKDEHFPNEKGERTLNGYKGIRLRYPPQTTPK